jgi:DNA-binding response OmpR family regulator
VALKILLADDNLTAQNMGKKILTEAGYEVIAVSNGAQAMKKIVSDNPDLVVLDVYMPGYSGLELCERLRRSRETATIPVILSVGKMEAFQPQEGNRVRADGLIVKPFEATELVAVVKKLAENVSPRRAKRSPKPEAASEPLVEATDSAAVATTAEPEFEIQHQAVNIPREIASAPVAGIELIPEEVREATQEQQAAAPVEFELEQAPAPVEFDSAPRMLTADGLSGVFELAPSAPSAVEAAAAPVLVDRFESSPMPEEAPTQFEEGHASAEDSIATTVEHDFVAAAPEEKEGAAQPEFTVVPMLESSSEPAAAEPPSSVVFDEEPLHSDPPEANAGSGTAPAEVSPELSPWEDAVLQPSVETAQVPADSMRNNSDGEASLHSDQPEVKAGSGTAPGAEALPELTPWDHPVIAPSVETAHVPTDSVLSNSEDEAPLDADQPEVSAGGGTAPEAEALPELSPWDDAVTAPSVETAHVPADSMLNNSETEVAPPAAVWVAEEIPIEPHELDVPLHLQMERQAREAPEPPPAASSAESPEREEPPSCCPEPTATVDAAEPQLEAYAADHSQAVPQIAVPLVTEAPVDPARIASIVDLVLERLRPELIAAVTRELEKNGK